MSRTRDILAKYEQYYASFYRRHMHDAANLRDRTNRTFAALTRTPGEDLRMVTTIIAAYVVAAEDDLASTVCEAVQAYHCERRTALMRNGYIRRGGRTRPPTRWAGVVEIDLLRAADECSDGKSRLLSGLGVDVDQVRPDQRVIVLHEHAVMDVRGHESADHLMHDLRNAFPGYRRLYGKTLNLCATPAQIRENMFNISGYITKFRYEYSDSMNGGPTKFGDRYEPEWRNLVERLYNSIGVDRMIDTNITVQSGKSALDKMYVFDQDEEFGNLENESKQPVLPPKQRQNGVFEPLHEIDQKMFDPLQLYTVEASHTDPQTRQAKLTNTCSTPRTRPSVQEIIARIRASSPDQPPRPSVGSTTITPQRRAHASGADLLEKIEHSRTKFWP